jgi:tetratricopeptide (TPR) repeat protein
MIQTRILLLCCLLSICSADLSADAETEKILDLWDFNDPKSTEVLFISLTEEAASSPNKDYAPVLLTQLARTYSLRAKFETANQILEEARVSLPKTETVAVAFYYLEKGRILNSSGDKHAALPYFRQAYVAAKKYGDDYLAVDAAHMVAIAEELGKQMKWNLIALEIAENSQSARARNWRGSLYNNMGWTFFDLENYEEALVLFKKGVDFRREKEQGRRLTIARWAVARTYRALGQLDKALEIQFELEREASARGLPDDGYVIEELAELYGLMGDPSAPEYFARAYRLLSQDEWLVKNEPARLERLKKLSLKDSQ